MHKEALIGEKETNGINFPEKNVGDSYVVKKA